MHLRTAPAASRWGEMLYPQLSRTRAHPLHQICSKEGAVGGKVKLGEKP